MSIFNWKKKKEKEEIFQSKIERIDLKTEKSNDTSRIIDLCEQMIDKAKELNELKEEYKATNGCLNDLVLFRELPDQQRKEIKEIAYNISQLELSRQNFMHIEKKITDAHFNQFETEENEIPSAVGRLKENERYLAVVERDMNFLENEKMKWRMYTEDLKDEQITLRRVAIAGFSIITIIFAILLVLQSSFGIDTKIYWMLSIFAAGIVGAFVYLKLQNNEDQKKKTNTNRNQAIMLLNKMKIKYVNAKNAVDYAREKYHVRNAKEFQNIWEKYLEAAKQKEKYELMNEDMEYFENKLRKALKEFRFFDSNLWVQKPRVFFEEEAAEKENSVLMTQRDHERTRIEFLSKSLKRQREETQNFVSQNDVKDEEVQSILDSIDKLSGVSM